MVRLRRCPTVEGYKEGFEWDAIRLAQSAGTQIKGGRIERGYAAERPERSAVPKDSGSPASR